MLMSVGGNSDRNSLVLSFNPLFALRILFLEWDVFFLGTASTIGGNSSSSVRRLGSADSLSIRVGAGVRLGARKRGQVRAVLISGSTKEVISKLYVEYTKSPTSNHPNNMHLQPPQ